LRDTPPITPAAMIFASKAVDGDVMVNDQVGNMQTANLRLEESSVEVGIFLRE
jgi:carbonic anhydrase/acetyltransferase-like protein (isoleucine patch superfamily)